MKAQEIAARFGGGKRQVGTVNGAHVWPCRCPLHGGDSNDSLHLWDGDGGSLGAKCHAGCSYQAVLDAAGVEFTYEGRRHVYGNGNGGHVNRRRGRGKDLAANYGSNIGLLVKLADDDAPENAAVLVEGEKAFDALAFNAPPGFTAAHWVGGSGSVEHANYSPLEGREVILWPDAGQVGNDTMAKAAVCLYALPKGVAQLWMVDTEGQPDTADAADVDAKTIAAMLGRVALYDPPPPIAEATEEAFQQGTGGFEKHSRGLRAIFNVFLLETRVNMRGGAVEIRRRDHGTSEGVALFKSAGLVADPMGWATLTSPATAQLRDLMERTFRDTNGKGYKHGEDTFRHYMLAMTAGERTDPVQHWLEALPQWDGVDRLPGLFTLALGADDTILNRATATAFMVGGIRRTYEPGCQHDWAPVIVGGQGGGKTTFVQELVPEDYHRWRGRVRNLADDTQKQVESINNAWIVEFPEMRGTHRLEQIKTYMDDTAESFRPPYAKTSELWPRRWVGIGTANDTGSGVLPDDPSGNRRYVAVLVEPPGETQEERSSRVRTYLVDNREQLWAEALYRYLAGEKSYLAGEFEEERDVMNTRYTRANQPVEDIAEMLTAEHADGLPVPLADLLIESKLAADLADASEKMQAVGTILAGELVKREWYKKRMTVDKRQQTLWFPPQRSDLAEDQSDAMDDHDGGDPPAGGAAGGDSGSAQPQPPVTPLSTVTPLSVAIRTRRDALMATKTPDGRRRMVSAAESKAATALDMLLDVGPDDILTPWHVSQLEDADRLVLGIEATAVAFPIGEWADWRSVLHEAAVMIEEDAQQRKPAPAALQGRVSGRLALTQPKMALEDA